MRIHAAALALGLLLPAAASAAAPKGPLVLKEKYADRFYNEPGFGWDTLPVVKVKATFTVPLDPFFTGPETAATEVSLSLGNVDFDSTLGEADRYVPGKSAKWTVRDDFTGKPAMKIKASWKKGVLKVVVSVKNEDGAFSDFFTGEEDLVIEDEDFDGTLAFGWAEFEFEGTVSGKADTRVAKKAGDEYDLSKVSIGGTAEITAEPEDDEAPWIDIFEPFDDDEVDTAETPVDWSVYDDTSISLVEYRVNGGPWIPLASDVLRDPDFGDASAEGILLLDTSVARTYTVVIRARDAFGNVDSVSVTFTVIFE